MVSSFILHFVYCKSASYSLITYKFNRILDKLKNFIHSGMQIFTLPLNNIIKMKKVDIEIITYNTTPHPLIFLFFSFLYFFTSLLYLSSV